MDGKIDYKGVNIKYYYEGGKGDPLVFLHGFCEDSHMWGDFIEGFEQFRVLLIDLPGAGASGTIKQLTIGIMADVVLKVLEHLKIDKYFLVGHSMGGYVSLELEAKQPGRIRGLTIFHSHPYADTEESKIKRDRAIEFIDTNGHELYIKQLIPKFFIRRYANSHTFLVDTMILRASRSSAEGVKNMLLAMKNRVDNSKVLETISCPVLFIIGEKDVTVSIERSMEQTYLPSVSEIHVLPHIGHMGMFTAEKETKRVIKRFLNFCLN